MQEELEFNKLLSKAKIHETEGKSQAKAGSWEKALLAYQKAIKFYQACYHPQHSMVEKLHNEVIVPILKQLFEKKK